MVACPLQLRVEAIYLAQAFVARGSFRAGHGPPVLAHCCIFLIARPHGRPAQARCTSGPGWPGRRMCQQLSGREAGELGSQSVLATGAAVLSSFHGRPHCSSCISFLCGAAGGFSSPSSIDRGISISSPSGTSLEAIVQGSNVLFLLTRECGGRFTPPRLSVVAQMLICGLTCICASYLLTCLDPRSSYRVSCARFRLVTSD